jgi:hypothetical protein
MDFWLREPHIARDLKSIEADLCAWLAANNMRNCFAHGRRQANFGLLKYQYPYSPRSAQRRVRGPGWPGGDLACSETVQHRTPMLVERKGVV